MIRDPMVDESPGVLDSGDIFLTPELEELLEQLAYASQFAGGIQVVEGPASSGKSVLARQFFEGYLTQCQHAAFVIAGQHQQTNEILAVTAEALGLAREEHRSIGETLAVLRGYAQNLQAQAQVAVLVIDDAHQLSEEAAAGLVSLLQGAGDSVFGLHLVLWSRPGMVARLDALQLVDIPVHDFTLPEMGAEDVEAYLEFLADRDAGWVVTTGSSSAELAAKGGGTIGGINRYLAQSQMVQALNNAPEQVDPLNEGEEPVEDLQPRARTFVVAGLPITHFAVLGLLVAVLSWALLVWESEPEQNADARIAQPIALPQPDQASIRAATSPDSGAPTAVAPFAVPDPTNDGSEAVADAARAGGGQSVNSAKGGSDSADETAVEDLEPVVDERELRNAIYGTAAPAQPTVETQSSEVADTEALTDLPQSEPQAQPQTRNQTQPQTAPPTASAAVADAAQLLKLPESSYSLQVMAASSRESVERFRREQPNNASLYLYQTERNGRDWFVLLTGNYPSREEASQAIASLPKAQRSAGPWPRKLDSVHAEISANRRR